MPRCDFRFTSRCRRSASSRSRRRRTISASRVFRVRTFRGDLNRRADSDSTTAAIEQELAELKTLDGGIEGARERFAARKAERAATQEREKREAEIRKARETEAARRLREREEAERRQREVNRKSHRGMGR